MDIDSEEQSAERAELHFLAALTDELMRTLVQKRVMTKEDIQGIEDAVSARTGTPPRAW